MGKSKVPKYTKQRNEDLAVISPTTRPHKDKKKYDRKKYKNEDKKIDAIKSLNLAVLSTSTRNLILGK